MKENLGLLKKMIQEEWRMHSTLFKGRSFATFPVMILLITFAFAYATTQYSTLGPGTVGTAVAIISGFLGLAVGNLGFSSRDAMKNVLGDTNYMVYASRTLPLSERKLLGHFVLKDLIYYTAMFILPIAVGSIVGTSFMILGDVLLMLPLFLAGILGSFVLARLSLSRPSVSLFGYREIGILEPLADKSVMDILRSSGGIFKLFFSLGLLTAFYWYVVLYFQITQVLLNNPLISYSVMIGLLNLSVYNWLNRFDSVDDYLHLPVDKKKLLTAKEEAYLLITVPLTVFFIGGSYVFYPQNFFISVATGIAGTLYNLAIAVYTTGLEPNEKLFDTWVFSKYMVLEILVAAPLLVLSIIYHLSDLVGYIYMAILTFSVIVSTSYLYLRDRP